VKNTKSQRTHTENVRTPLDSIFPLSLQKQIVDCRLLILIVQCIAGPDVAQDSNPWLSLWWGGP